jgi:hypothetical protein
MARHVAFGEPVNESERWAFRFLEEGLPDTYWLATNVDLVAQSGQRFEVDAIVVGEWGVYMY